MTSVVLWSSSAGDIPANLAFTNNFAAITDPGVGNDTTQGYTPGSRWINVADGRVFTCQSNAAGAAVWIQAGGAPSQGAPFAATVSATLTAAQIQTGLITVLQGGGANSAQQLPLATAMDAAFPSFVANSYFDFSVANISVSAGETASITTNTGWTLVGEMTLAITTSARFRARKTGAGAWTLYRLS
jgi:hypothetical protein